MDNQIISRSDEWRYAIASECRSLLENDSVENYSLFEQLQILFDEEKCRFSDDRMFRHLRSKYNLHVSIVSNDYYHLSELEESVVRMSRSVCHMVPDTLTRDVDYRKRLNELLQRFKKTGARAVYRIFRNQNAAIVEVQIKAPGRYCKDFIYWNRDEICIISFVSEFDEDHKVDVEEQVVFCV